MACLMCDELENMIAFQYMKNSFKTKTLKNFQIQRRINNHPDVKVVNNAFNINY